jgi:hypothetical protein
MSKVKLYNLIKGINGILADDMVKIITKRRDWVKQYK